MNMHRIGVKRGFSLVEVCLAVLVVGLGLLSVFSLFPTGLASGESAAADTEIGLFADQVLNGLQAQATEVTWAEWQLNQFSIPFVPGGSGNVQIGLLPGSLPAMAKDGIGYYLYITPGAVRTKEAILYATPWKQEKTRPALSTILKGSVFYTQITYTELPP